MSETIHVRKFMDGKMTPDEAHRQTAWAGGCCMYCGSPKPAVRIQLFGLVSECIERHAQWCMQEAAKHDGRLPIVNFTYGKFVRMQRTYACDGCRSRAEREAAQGQPSYVLVEFDYGPGPDKPVVQVPRNGMWRK